MDELYLTVGSEVQHLHGPAVTGAFRGASYAPCASSEAAVTDTITLVLEGTEAQAAAGLLRLGQLLRLARENAQSPGKAWGYLVAGYAAGGAARSKLIDGWLEIPPTAAGARVRGRLGVVLKLVRENWWEGEEVSLALDNLHGAQVTSGLAWTNHKDAGHANTAYVAGADLAGNLPAPVRLEVAVTTSTTGTLWAGLGQGDGPELLLTCLQGEAAAAGSGVTGTLAADAACSGGAKQTLAWSGAGAAALGSWALPGAALTRMAGRSFAALLRLAAVPTEPALWTWLRLSYTGSSKETVWDGPGRYLTTTDLIQELGSLELPPWKFLSGSLPDMTLELMCQGLAGSHSLVLDELHLLPQDGWRKYVPVLAAVQSLGVKDDSERNACLALASPLLTHAAEGPGFWLRPGEAALFVLLAGQGAVNNVAAQGTIKVLYRPRRSNL